MKRIFTWLTATASTTIVGIAAATTTMFIIANPIEVVNNLAPAVVGGVGTTLGAAAGSLLILRFKTVRAFIKNLIHERE